MLRAKDRNLDNCIEFTWTLLEKALSAVGDDVVHKLEETTSKLWKIFFVVLNHHQRWLAKRKQNLRKELHEVLAIFSQNCGKQHQSFWVACKRI